MKLLTRLIVASGITVALLTSGTAMADRSSANVAIAEAGAVLRAAENDGADQHAVIALKAARAYLSKAQVDLDNRRWDAAERAAVRAVREAELADAKTRALKTEGSLAELQATVDTLKTELDRLEGES